MHPATLSILACPSCRHAYQAVIQRQSGEQIEQGFLRCSCRASVIPIIEGFALFTESLLHEGLADAKALEQLAQKLFGTAQDFEDYVRDKQSRNVIEAYAAFQPFNESGRAVAPLLPHLEPALLPGGFVLDTWCRTGWSGEWLAGLLPAQRVISLWEGNSSVLGYRGFRHVLGTGRRARNLDIIFSHPERPLPFRSDAFDLLYSHDALHRFNAYPFASECLRVTRAEGALVFAHVHLANGEPEPFFERGGIKIHGQDYRAWLNRVTAPGARRGFVFSEATLFDGPPIADLTDDPLTPHYNGLIAIVPPGEPAPKPASAPEPVRYIVNPMFRFNQTRNTARLAPELYSGSVAHFLGRHPVYQARLPVGPVALDGYAWLALLLSAGGADRAEQLAVRDGATPMIEALDSLATAEILRPASVGAAAHFLQRLHANQYAFETAAVLQDCLHPARTQATASMSLDDGSVLTGEEVTEFAARVRSYLAAQRIVAGDWIAVSPGAQPLLWVAAIAAANTGIHVRLFAQGEGGRTRAAGSRLGLCSDAEAAGLGWTGLGLNGAPHSLLSALADQGPAQDTGWTGTGWIEVPMEQGVVRCPIGRLAAGCMALRNQRDGQLLVLEGSDPFKDLITVLTALVAEERLRVA